MIGFAAETTENMNELVLLAQGKLTSKGADLIIANNVNHGAIFGSEETEIHMVEAENFIGPIKGSKLEVAHAVVHRLSAMLKRVDFTAPSGT